MMSARHCLSESPKRRSRPAENKAARTSAPLPGILRTAWSVVFGSMILAAVLAAFLADAAGREQTPPAAGQHEQVSQEGTLIAVSAVSVTARSPDGITRTYLVTPETAVITRAGRQFAVHDEVAIVGTIQGGTALATAVAHRELGHGDVPPMDCVAAKPVNGELDSD